MFKNIDSGYYANRTSTSPLATYAQQGIVDILEVKDRKPIIASEKETKNNNRARSAKLRYAIKIQDHSFEFKRSHLNLEKYFQLEEVMHA